MLVDLNLLHKKVLLVIFDQKEALFRLRQLHGVGSKATLVTTSKIAVEARKLPRLDVIEVDPAKSFKVTSKIIKKIRPYLTVISTKEEHLDRVISETARRLNSLTYVVDSPRLNDLNMPAIARLGQIRVAISTGGLSPAMASILRKRIEKEIHVEDILSVKLQGELRDEIKIVFPEINTRRKAIYTLLNNRSIKTALKKGNYTKASILCRSKMRKLSGGQRREKN